MDYERGFSIAVRFPQLMALIIGWVVLMSALAGIGIYFGLFSYPMVFYGQQQAPGHFTQFALPYLLPSLETVKLPYTFLPSEGNYIGVVSVVAIIILILAQNFVTGMYLGGIRQGILIDDPSIVHERTLSPLLPAGKKYFARLTGWSVLFWIVFAPLMAMFAAILPVALLLFFGFMFYMLTPYLVVIKDIPLSVALGLSPGLFSRYFGRLLPLAIVSVLLMALSGLMSFLPRPYHYIFVLMAISFFGTAMNAAFMVRLGRLMAEDSLLPGYWKRSGAWKLAYQAEDSIRASRKWRWRLAILLLPLLGAFFASGYHLMAFSPWGEKEWSGTVQFTNYTLVYFRTDYNYMVYEWHDQPVKLSLHLPDLAGEKEPRTISGIGQITWDVKQSRVERARNGTNRFVEPVETKTSFFYRLRKEESEKGNAYYSTREGEAGLIYWHEPGQEKLTLELMVGGHGENLFVLQYPVRLSQGTYQSMFGGERSVNVPELLRASSDGKFLLPEHSEVNSRDFKYFWLKESLTQRDIFEFIAAKNERNELSVLNGQLPALLAIALQEADGNMVVRIMRKMADTGIKLDVPDWSAEEWTRYLREQYQGLTISELFGYLNETVEFLPQTAIESGEGGTNRQRITVSFPHSNIQLLFSEKENEIIDLKIQFSKF